MSLLALTAGVSAIWFAFELGAGANEASWLLLPRLAALARFLAGVAVLVAVLDLVFAYGSWTLKSWAWPLGVGLELVALVLAVLRLGRGVPGSHLAVMVLAIGILWYLYRPEVRVAFRA